MVVFKGFSPNEYFEWEDSHPLCSNTLSPSGSVMITITITITSYATATIYLRENFSCIFQQPDDTVTKYTIGTW